MDSVRLPLGISLAAALWLVLLVGFAPPTSPGEPDMPITITRHRVDELSRSAAPPARSKAVATSHRTGREAFEPTLGVAADGTIYFQAARNQAAVSGLLSFVPEVLRSSDRGKTWDDVSPRLADSNLHAFTADPYLHLDPDTDRVFTVDWVPATYCSQLSSSDDGGESWSSTVLACGGSDHQNVFTGPPSLSVPALYPNVVYYCGQSIPTAICSKSLDGGRSFAPTGAPPFAEISDVLACGRSTGHGSVGPHGTVYVPTACEVPYVALSETEGASWTVVTVSEKATSGDHETAVGADGDGNVYYAWIGKDRLPYLSISTDGGYEWRDPVMIAPPGVTEANIPALAVAPDGSVAVAYLGSSNAPGGGANYDGVTWGAFLGVSINALAAKPVFETARFGDAKDPLVTGTCGPGRCQAQYDFIDVQIDRQGTAWVAFIDGCEGRRCREIGEGVVGSLAVRRPR